MRKQFLLVIIFILIYIGNGWVCLKGFDDNVSCYLFISMIICTIMQGILSYNLKSKSALSIFIFFSFFLCMQLYYYPFFYGTKRDYSNIEVDNDTTFTKIYDYFDDISSYDSLPCLILKEGEVGAYYYDLYLYGVDSFEVSLYIWPIDSPNICIYQKKFKTKIYSHNNTVIKDSFIVSTGESVDLIPSYFEVMITKLDNYQKQVIKRKYLLHRWRR